MDYTKLSLAEIASGLDSVAQEAQATFGGCDVRQLNWRPDAARWSVAQCFDHLLQANREMFQAIDAAMDPSIPRTVWQRLPVLPRIFGLMLIKSQMPDAKRKFTAPRKAKPAMSAIDPRIIGRFVAAQHEAVARVRSLDAGNVSGRVMVSPFVRFIAYSVLDGCRLIVTHERRHFEQARRVTRDPRFPSRPAAAG
jgi:hypothetical protein